MNNHSTVKAALETKLNELLQRAVGIEDVLSSPGSPDWQDNAIESEQDEVLSEVGAVTKNEIHEIKLALSRIESGTYGKCSSCGANIPAERLAAIPYATTCVKCA